MERARMRDFFIIMTISLAFMAPASMAPVNGGTDLYLRHYKLVYRFVLHLAKNSFLICVAFS